MSSLASLVAAHGLILEGQGSIDHPDEAVRALQLALSQAGFKMGVNGVYDGVFGDGTKLTVRRFQAQHHLVVDGRVGLETATELDKRHDILIDTAEPQTKLVQTSSGPVLFPHDDTASMIAFYGKPWEDASLIVSVELPFSFTYDGRPFGNRVQFHRKAADRLRATFDDIWNLYGRDQAALDRTHITKFSGTYVDRPVRGSSRRSCHAFAAAIDLDAEDNPLGQVRNTIPANIVAVFEANGFFWGGRFTTRKDNMHFQAAHE